MNASTLVKAAREAAGLTQAQLAERAGVTQPEVARLEAPGANPRLQTLKHVVAAAGSELDFALRKARGIDPTLIAESLRGSPGMRLRAAREMHEFARRNTGKAREHGD